MKASEKMSIFIWWIFVPAALIIFSYSSIDFLNEVRSLERIDLENSIQWDSSKNSQAELLENIQDINSGKENPLQSLNQAFKLDPENGYLDFLAIANSVNNIGYIEEDDENQAVNIYIEDQEELQKALGHFEELLSKPKYNTYELDLFQEMRRNGKKSYIGLIKDFTASIGLHNYRIYEQMNKFLMFYLVYDNPEAANLKERAVKINFLSNKLINNSKSLVSFICTLGINAMAAKHLVKQDPENKYLGTLIESFSIMANDKLLGYDSAKNIDYKPYLSKLAKITTPATRIPENYSKEIENNRLLEYTHYELMAIEISLGVISLLIFNLLIFLLYKTRNEAEGNSRILPNRASVFYAGISCLCIFILYFLLRNSLWSRQFSSTEIKINAIFISEVLSFSLLSIALPLKILFNYNKPNKDSNKNFKDFIFLIPLTLPLWAVWIIPDEVTLTLIGIVPFCYLFIFLIRSTQFFSKLENINWIIFKLKTLIIFLSCYGIFLFSFCKPLVIKSAKDLYTNDKVSRIATELGYTCSYTEALTLEYAKTKITESLKTHSYKAELDHKNSYKLKLFRSK